jgi:hypothetical protein
MAIIMASIRSWLVGSLAAENILRVTDISKRLHSLVWLVNCRVKLVNREGIRNQEEELLSSDGGTATGYSGPGRNL